MASNRNLAQGAASPTTDPRVDAYIAASPDYARPILTSLRTQIHAACPAVVETIKWSRPAFLYQGQIMVGLSAFKAHAAFGFWQDVAYRPGERDAFDHLTGMADLPDAARIAELTHEAMALIDAGKGKMARPKAAPKPEPEVPAALAAALESDAKAKAAFVAFPPSCRREYCEWIADAKRDETRAKRVTQTIEWLREGKRRNWKYENC
ncbi:YdeI/OmpD-associated family protein [Sphingomonas sp. GlSt437]|uniref:YdeI/OmpD-associated family protein n=1 Tax=Sphingomonas sp. GlSt437 TaxID=3389970 RepID=UPI003A8601F1